MWRAKRGNPQPVGGSPGSARTGTRPGAAPSNTVGQLQLKNHLKAVRARHGYSQQDVATLVGVSRNTISSIETGAFNPTAKLALVLCIALEVPFEELFYFADDGE